MKVAIVTGLCIERDAISDSVVEQRRALLGAGHEVMVYAHVGSALGPGEVVETADAWWMWSHPDYAAADLVILHHGIHYDLFNALLLGHPRAALVVHFHNITPPELLSGASARAATDGLDQLAIASRAHGAWCDSRHNAEVLVANADIDMADIRVLPLSVPGACEASCDAKPGGRCGFVSVGRLVEAKGYRELIGAYASLPENVRDAHPLRIIGRRMDSSAAHPEELVAHAAGLGVQEHVSVEVDLPAAERDAAYRNSLVFVTASHHEGFCVPVIEALAAGCRVVATEVGALPETVGGMGQVVPLGEADAFAGALLASLDEGSAPDDATVHRYMQTFSPESFARRTLFEAEAALVRGTGRTMAEVRGDRVEFAEKQAALLSVLACPRCRAGLSVEGAVEVAGAIAAADLTCPRDGRVGTIRDFRPGFLPRNLSDDSELGSGGFVQRADLGIDVTYVGEWQEVPEGRLCEGNSSETAVFSCAPSGFGLSFLGHDWSGQVHVGVEGGPTWTLDLHRSEPAEVVFESGDLGPGMHRVSISATGQLPEGSQGAQVVLSGIRRSVPPEDLRAPGLGLVNRGNPYPDRFPDLVATMPPDGLALDCGGGDRRYGDPRVFNLEYMDYELPDLYGDGLALPFADDSFDLVQSQAVLEHVPDPQRAVDEIVRILKPGGLAYFEIAFMQPLHAVPSHFMNVTPHGIEYLCRNLEVIEKGEFGGLAETMTWIGGLVSASEKVGEQRFAEVTATLAELDSRLSPDELRMAASAVYLLGRKP